MEADYGCAAAAVGDRMAGRIREIPDDPAIPGPQPGHEPGRFQGHLLVGMVASLAGTPDRRCFSSAILVFSLARRDSRNHARAPVGDFWRWRRDRKSTRLNSSHLG